jgi:hypothetical protein
MTRRLFLGIFAVGASLVSCRERSSQEQSTAPRAEDWRDSPIAKVWVSKSGVVELNGKQVTLEAVSASLTDLAKRRGVVVYGRESPQEEPHPNGMKVMELAMANRLPIRMSTKRDFSDAIGPDGKIMVPAESKSR